MCVGDLPLLLCSHFLLSTFTNLANNDECYYRAQTKLSIILNEKSITREEGESNAVVFKFREYGM